MMMMIWSFFWGFDFWAVGAFRLLRVRLFCDWSDCEAVVIDGSESLALLLLLLLLLLLSFVGVAAVVRR